MSRLIVSALAAATLVAGGLAATPVAADSAPKNVIVLIGDGMGYNHIDNASSYLAGTTRWQVEWDPATFTGGELGGTPSQEFETWNRVSQQTFPVTGSYDPKAAWSDFNWVKKHPTDSAAAGTALAMVEGGAIDWTGHANDEVRNIEETVDFFDAVSTVSQWVEANSSWKETLVIVTADHETGYLVGPESDPAFDAMTGNKGEVPKLSWHSGDHTNVLVPVFFKGAGAATLAAHATGEHPVRGAFLDNTALANFLIEDLWRAADPTEEPTEQPTEQPTEAPTEAPTEQPTEAPTEQPTEQPTHDAKPLPIGPKQPGKPIASAPKMPVTGGELIMLALLASGLISSGVVLVRRRQAS